MTFLRNVLLSALFLSLISAAVGAGRAHAATLDRVGGFDQGCVFGLAVDGTTAYVGNGNHLQKVDLTEPDHPTFVENLPLGGFAVDVQLGGDYAYVLTWPGGVHVVDVSGPGTMIEVGSLDPAGETRHLVVEGSYAFLANAETGLICVDISTPAAPDSVGALALNGAYAVAVKGATAYVLDEDGLFVVDVTDPTDPAELHYFPYAPQNNNDPGALCVDGDRLCVVYEEGLRPLDISDPANPVPGEANHVGFVGFGIGAGGGYVYLTDWTAVQVFNVTNPNTPIWVGAFDLGRTGHHAGALIVNGNLAYYADTYHGLSVLDVSNPAAVTEQGLAEVPGYFTYVARDGDLAAFGCLTRVWLFDVSDAAQPDTLGSLPVGLDEEDMKRMLLRDGYLYLLWEDEFRVFNIANPAAPVEVYEYPSFTTLADMVFIKEVDMLVIAAEDDLLFLDISDPENIATQGSVETASWPLRMLVHNGYLYAAAWTAIDVFALEGLGGSTGTVFPCDSMNLDAPHSEVDGFVLDATENLLYLGREEGQIIAFDISDPCNLDIAGETAVTDEIEGLAVCRTPGGDPGLLVLNKIDDGPSNVYLFDFSDPAHPVEGAVNSDLVMGEELAIWEDELIVTAGLFGFHILDTSPYVPVTLARFAAERRAGAAVLRWELGQADSRSVFFVWREEGDGERIRLNESPLSGERRFEFTDPAAPAGEATYWLQELDVAGGRHWLGSVTLAAADAAARRPVLYPNAPNPFAPRTRIEFDLPAAGPVHLAVYDAGGRLVTVLLDGPQPAGRGQVAWDGRDAAGRPAASGVYFTVLRAGDETQRRKVVLAR